MITTFEKYAAGCAPCEMIGLSTDTKPVNVCNASVFLEMDTQKIFLFDEEHKQWHEQ